MKDFIKSAKDAFGTDIKKDLYKIKEFGSFEQANSFNQKTFFGSIISEEIIHINPKNPFYKKGTLLHQNTFESVYETENITYPKRLGSVCDPYEYDDLYHTPISIDNIDYASNLGRRVQVSTTILVLKETIEIKKTQSAQLKKTKNKIANKHKCIYKVTHYIHALDKGKKISFPTTLFSQGRIDAFSAKRAYDSDQACSESYFFEDDLDLDLIFHIYNNTWTEDIIAPLKIAK